VDGEAILRELEEWAIEPRKITEIDLRRV